MDEFEKALEKALIKEYSALQPHGPDFKKGAIWAKEWIYAKHRVYEDHRVIEEKLRAENQRLREALEWYMNNCDCCSTDVATQALSEVSE